MGELDGRTALVTGGGRGIGRAVAELLAERGAQVMIADIDGDLANGTATAIGGAAAAVQCDVSSSEDVAGAVTATLERFGGVDILVANAGIEIVKPLFEQSEQEFRKLMEINVTGVFLSMKHALPSLIERKGCIVNLASVAGIGGAPLLGSYCASKAGVVQLTRVAAIELRDAGVRVNAVCPGFVDTPMVDRAGVEVEAQLGVPFTDLVAAQQGRLGTVDEVAETVAFLASDRAGWTTGSHYVLDGGLTASMF